MKVRIKTINGARRVSLRLRTQFADTSASARGKARNYIMVSPEYCGLGGRGRNFQNSTVRCFASEMSFYIKSKSGDRGNGIFFTAAEKQPPKVTKNLNVTAFKFL